LALLADEFVLEDAVQPNNDGQAAGRYGQCIPNFLLIRASGNAFEDKVGLGSPTENPCVKGLLAHSSHV